MRNEDWPERLHEYIESRRDMPFAWGTNDCVTFAAGAILAMTGRDLIGVPRWDSAATAMRILQEMGGMESVADKLFERVTKPGRGHLGLVSGDREFFGVIWPPYVYTPGEKHMLGNSVKVCRVIWAVQ